MKEEEDIAPSLHDALKALEVFTVQRESCTDVLNVMLEPQCRAHTHGDLITDMHTPSSLVVHRLWVQRKSAISFSL